MTMRPTSLCLLAVWLTAMPVCAHDILLFANGGADSRVVVRYGHPGDWQEVDRHKLIELDAIGRDGGTASLLGVLMPVRNTFEAPLGASSDGGGRLLAARYDNGFWVKLADGSYRNARRSEVSATVSALSSFKFAKAWVASGRAAGDDYRRVVGHRLEIVPLADPMSIAPGGSLPLRVLWGGRPLAGARLEIGDGVTERREEDIPRHATDADGVAALPVEKTGWQVIAVDHEAPAALPALADVDRFVATFVFALPAR